MGVPGNGNNLSDRGQALKCLAPSEQKGQHNKTMPNYWLVTHDKPSKREVDNIFCKGSVDTTILGVDTMVQNKGRNVKKSPSQVDTSPEQVDTGSSQVDTRDLSQGIVLPVWDSVSTHLLGRCNKPGHMKGECPENKKEKHKKIHKFKKPKAMVATWSDEDTSENEEEEKSSSSGSEEICFMANSSDGKLASQKATNEFKDLSEKLEKENQDKQQKIEEIKILENQLKQKDEVIETFTNGKDNLEALLGTNMKSISYGLGFDKQKFKKDKSGEKKDKAPLIKFVKGPSLENTEVKQKSSKTQKSPKTQNKDKATRSTQSPDRSTPVHKKKASVAIVSTLVDTTPSSVDTLFTQVDTNLL
ncbi:hypothetical protein Taro_026745 [Colocasia esculenta]|uniref:CCHC-type domain-containing protein n=1 Tax=Colocasia esculenta TaxID=4460 RepID=A0A843VC72_COLES|nr:hypothetical protein [Colocasia esculenta]